MRGALLSTMNGFLLQIRNKQVFQNWFIVRSKWVLTFIQRGELKEIQETQGRVWKGRNLRVLTKWIKENEIEKVWSGNGWVYSMLCMVTGDWYIGSTKRSIEERLREHLYEARRVWNKDKMERTVLHKAMWRTGVNNWIIVPLYKMEEEDQLRTLERNLIEKLEPNLNRRRSKEERIKGKRKRPPKKNRTNKHETKKENRGLTL